MMPELPTSDLIEVLVLAGPAAGLRLRRVLAHTPTHVCTQVEVAAAAVAAAVELAPDVCLVELSASGDVLWAVEEIAARARSRIIVLADHPEEVGFLEAILVGASGYLPLDLDAHQFWAAVCEVLRGGAAVPRRFERTLIDQVLSLG